MKKQSEIDKLFGPVCKKCGIRHTSFTTRGQNLPKSQSNKCKG